MAWKFNPFTQQLDIVGTGSSSTPAPATDLDKILTAELTINTIGQDNYSTNDVQMVVIDNDGNVVTEE